MRSATFFSALFAVAALAQSLEEKRDVVVETETNVVYTTVVMQPNGNAAPVATPAAAPAAAPGSSRPVLGHHHKHVFSGHHHKHNAKTHEHPAAHHSGSSRPFSGHHHKHNAEKHEHPHNSGSSRPFSGHHHKHHGFKGHHHKKHHASAPKVKPEAATNPQPDVNTYSGAGVQSHNHHRKEHSAPEMVWDDDLAASAASLAAGCVFEHNTSLGPASNYGQNIASSYPPSGSTADELKKVITQMWYKGEAGYFNGLYGQPSPDMTDFEHWGHFTQVVWKDSRRVGCATQTCDGMGYFTVCNYGAAGNMMGEFDQNVYPPVN